MECVAVDPYWYWLGDGSCDEDYGANLNCEELDFDYGDCVEPEDDSDDGTTDDADSDDGTADDADSDDGTTDDVDSDDGTTDEGDVDGTDPEPVIGDECADGRVYDCAMYCADESIAAGWVGDGYCDEGLPYDLNCAFFDFDDGDCE
jgi:hypothetical protein